MDIHHSCPHKLSFPHWRSRTTDFTTAYYTARAAPLMITAMNCLLEVHVADVHVQWHIENDPTNLSLNCSYSTYTPCQMNEHSPLLQLHGQTLIPHLLFAELTLKMDTNRPSSSNHTQGDIRERETVSKGS